MRRHSNKLLAIVAGVIFTLPCIVMFSSVYTISDSYAQGKAATGGADKIKAALLRPGGWAVEWRSEMGKGLVDFVFEARGENVVVKIVNAAYSTTCERNVTITSDVVKLDGCFDTNISLTFDPDDHEYPFKGESQENYYKLKAK